MLLEGLLVVPPPQGEFNHEGPASPPKGNWGTNAFRGLPTRGQFNHEGPGSSPKGDLSTFQENGPTRA